MDFIIRFAKEYDIEEMAEIHAFGKKEAYSGIIDESTLNKSIDDSDYRIEQMLERYGKRNTIVAEKDGEVIGFAQWVFGNESSSANYADSELCSLYIRPDLKGYGVGTKLLCRVKELCAAASHNRLALFCLKENLPSIHFYEKNGGKIIGETMLNFGNKKYASVIFLFDLATH